MRIERLRLKNFLSFKELDHIFRNEPTLVQGKNLSEESKESNGSGKSTMQAGVAYALMATPLRKQALDRDLIYWGENEAEIELTMYCPIRNQRLVISRTLRVKGSSTLNLTINDEPVVVATVLEGNRFILDWVSISPEDIKSFYILNKENYKSFLSSSNTDKLALINRFIKADGLDNAEKVIKDESKPYQEAIENAQRDLYTAEGELRVYMSQLEDEQGRDVECEREEKMNIIKSHIVEWEGVKEADEKDRKEFLEKKNELLKQQVELKVAVDKANKKLEEARKITFDEDAVQLTTLHDRTYRAEVEAKKLKKEDEDTIAALNSGIASLSTVLAGKIVCPVCGHEFFVSSGKTVKEVEDEIRGYQEELKNWEEDLQQVNELMKDIASEWEHYENERSKYIEKANNHLRLLNTLRDNLNAVEKTYKASERDIENYDRWIGMREHHINFCEEELKRYKSELQRVSEEKIETRVEELSSMVTLQEKKVSKLQDKVLQAEKALGDFQQWGQRFKDFKMSLACEQLKSIQDTTNSILQKQHSELRVSLDGFKVNAKGQIKSEITLLVINEEGEYCNFWGYSGGERARVEFAIIQAFQEMINATNPYGGLDFLMIDEVLEGTDPLGLNLIMESMQGINYPVYLITHTMNIRTGVSTLTVVKENKESRIENE